MKHDHPPHQSSKASNTKNKAIDYDSFDQSVTSATHRNSLLSAMTHTAGGSGGGDHSSGSVWDEDAATSRGDFTLAGSVKLAKHIEEQVKAHGRAEQRKGSKVVYISLLVAAVGFGLATYYLIQLSQENTFQSEFASYARETADIAENNAESTFGQLKALSTAITSIANHDDDEFTTRLVVDRSGSSGLPGQDDDEDYDNIFGDRSTPTTTTTNTNFPYITIPHFDLRTQEISDLTGIEMIAFVPFVAAQDRPTWQQYTVDHQYWIQQDYIHRSWDTSKIQTIPHHIYNYTLPPNYNDTRRGFVDSNGFMEEILANLSYASEGFSTPVAQFGPGPINTSLAMMDLFSHPIFKKEIVASLEYDVPVISETEDLEFLLKHIHHANGTTMGRDYNLLRSFTLDQVKENFEEGARTVGYLVGVVPWNTFFRNLLPENVNGIVVKVASDCGKNFTYIVNGGKDDWARDGDWHDPKYEHMAQQYKFFWKDHHQGVSRHCHFDLIVYPSDEFYSHYKSNDPILYAFVVVAVCAFMAIVFFGYDRYMQNHQNTIMSEKARTHAVVTALFPAHVSERLLADKRAGRLSSIPNIMSLTSAANKSKPLADLFPSATIMFADIAGFTAWSSVREPSMVFTLLESIYQSFDFLAKKNRVFKVETIGDCYVAVAGLPDTRPDHAMAMACFARDCLETFQDLVRQLEVELGPDTAELGLRVGLHSGPVTAGVLRGERARFQLFGDTVNTTARIESLGQAGRIHLSQETAQELRNWNKEDWLMPREDQVEAKGKGVLQTYWLVMPDDKSERTDGTSVTGELSDVERNSRVDSNRNLVAARVLDEKIQRLVDWNTEILLRLLEQVVARRRATDNGSSKFSRSLEKTIDYELRRGRMVIDEVMEVITLPNYNHCAHHDGPQELSRTISGQLRAYVARIAQLYGDNPFHNFEHASHVAMSVSKLLSRIVAPKLSESHHKQHDRLEAALHDHTYGITSDPLTQFACVFSAVIHDAEHTGLPNAQLVKEGTDMAIRYNNVSVAEQNSVDVAWGILMEPEFKQLRSAIYCSEAEMIRFRQLVVNSVMATDIVDKRLKTLRNARWEKAFSSSGNNNSRSISQESADDVNRKATIVIEHLIQASDVSHTMQHWHVFHKWNENLFREMYLAYLNGKAEKNPADFWYKGEIGFFQFYIIPLAKKLKDCGVFGVSSDEYLNYAEQNLAEWKQKGEALVEGYISSFKVFEAKRRDKLRRSSFEEAARRSVRQIIQRLAEEELSESEDGSSRGDVFRDEGLSIEC